MRWLFVLAASAASVFAQLPAPNDSGVAMGHIHLMVADPEAHKKLWVSLLGAEVTHAGTLEMLKLPGIFIVVGKARTPPAEGTEGSTVNHIGFLVKSYADIKARVAAAGLELAMDNPANKQITAVFPDKVKVEFTEDAAAKAGAMHDYFRGNPDKLQPYEFLRERDVRKGIVRIDLHSLARGGDRGVRAAARCVPGSRDSR